MLRPDFLKIYFFDILKWDSLPALMYSPPSSRTTEAIFAKLSEPKNLLGLTIMNLPLSSKNNIAESSGEKACLTSLMSCLVSDGNAESEGVVGAGLFTVFRDLETSAKSPEITFRTLMSSSTFWAKS